MKIITDNLKAIIAIIVVVSAFAYFFITYFAGKAQSDPQVIIAIVGAMTTVLGYLFGSSQRTEKKEGEATVTNAETVNVDQSKGK